VAASHGVPSPATPPTLSPIRRPSSASPPSSAPRQNAEPQCELAATAAYLSRGPWCTVALCTHHTPGATGQAHPRVQQFLAGGKRQSAAQTEGQG
jgi:hypothetical protein